MKPWLRFIAVTSLAAFSLYYLGLYLWRNTILVTRTLPPTAIDLLAREFQSHFRTAGKNPAAAYFAGTDLAIHEWLYLGMIGPLRKIETTPPAGFAQSLREGTYALVATDSRNADKLVSLALPSAFTAFPPERDRGRLLMLFNYSPEFVPAGMHPASESLGRKELESRRRFGLGDADALYDTVVYPIRGTEAALNLRGDWLWRRQSSELKIALRVFPKLHPRLTRAGVFLNALHLGSCELSWPSRSECTFQLGPGVWQEGDNQLQLVLDYPSEAVKADKPLAGIEWVRRQLLQLPK